ncbi:hypothetical protein C8J56DRAFT_312542 [Mycena floridula]|nr:hypothetical protein C8J56DRAFT_312542 [Mycena floridula]
MFPPRPSTAALQTVAYAILVVTTVCATLLSCLALLSQAVRTSPSKSWSHNINALIIGASYAIVLIASLLFCAKRRLAVYLKLQKISKASLTLGRSDIPSPVQDYIKQEYVRSCAIAFESQPKNSLHEGWGTPGTRYEGIYFRRHLLDTIQEIDTLARLVIPTHPTLKPHARMLHHFRFIVPLLTSDEDELTPLHFYDSAIQLARNSHRQPTEQEFEAGMDAADEIKAILSECWLECMEASSTRRAGSTES